MQGLTENGWAVVVLSFPGRKMKHPEIWAGGFFSTRAELIEAWDTKGPGWELTMRWVRARRAGHVMACHAFMKVSDCRLSRALAGWPVTRDEMTAKMRHTRTRRLAGGNR